ncbi:MAG: peptidase MA family metallohydrolase [Bacillota bacterium]
MAAISEWVARVTRRWMKGFILVGLVVALLVLRCPGKAKALGYTIAREVAKYHALVQTLFWPQVKGQYFLVRYHSATESTVALILETAEEAYKPVIRLLGHEPPLKVPIILHPDRASIGKAFGWEADQSAMGVYWAGVIRILAPTEWAGEDPEEMSRVFKETGPMVHELAHLVVDYRTGGNYTRWFTEGVAQYAEREIINFTFPEPAKVAQKGWYPLEKMGSDFDNLENQSLAYYQSLAMVDYLIDLGGGFPAVQKVMEQLRHGRTMDEAIEAVTGKTTTEFSEGFAAWWEGNRPAPASSAASTGSWLQRGESISPWSLEPVNTVA